MISLLYLGVSNFLSIHKCQMENHRLKISRVAKVYEMRSFDHMDQSNALLHPFTCRCFFKFEVQLPLQDLLEFNVAS